MFSFKYSFWSIFLAKVDTQVLENIVFDIYISKNCNTVVSTTVVYHGHIGYFLGMTIQANGYKNLHVLLKPTKFGFHSLDLIGRILGLWVETLNPKLYMGGMRAKLLKLNPNLPKLLSLAMIIYLFL